MGTPLGEIQKLNIFETCIENWGISVRETPVLSMEVVKYCDDTELNVKNDGFMLRLHAPRNPYPNL